MHICFNFSSRNAELGIPSRNSAIDQAKESIEVILALRSSETPPGTGPSFPSTERFSTLRASIEKRVKRMRLSSPSAPGTPQNRGSAAPSSASATVSMTPAALARLNKAGPSRIGPQQRLEPGRKVAFKQPPRQDPESGETTSDWILAEIRSFIPPNKSAEDGVHFSCICTTDASRLQIRSGRRRRGRSVSIL